MSALLYREDMDAVRRRLTTWWEGGDIGRPAMLITAPRPAPLSTVPAVPPPAGWVTDYSTRSLQYRVNLAQRACVDRLYLAEAVPCVSPDLGPNCLALYLGCRGVEMPGTVWFEPCIAEVERARFEYDPENFYWRFTLRLAREMLAWGRGKYLLQFPDLIEGLDTLAAMRGTEPLLLDLVERPAWVHAALRRITDLYFHYYDVLYDLIRDEVGGSVFWCWAPGRMAKFQCDFSAMISAEMFAEFMVPVLREMCERVSYCMYHWDGPGALQHCEHLLAIPGLTMVQWTPGDGHEPTWNRRWWPYYHRVVEAGKKVYVHCWGGDADALRALRREFGPKLKHFLLGIEARSADEAEALLKVVEF